MKKFIAILLTLSLLLSMAACGGNNSDIKDAIKKFKMIHKEPATADIPEEPPMEDSEEIAVEEADEGFAEDQSYPLEDYYGDSVYNVSFTLPENMWVVDSRSDKLYIYNVESLDVAHSASPRIQFEIKDADSVDSQMKHATEIEYLDPRTIGGIEMQGRYYKMVGMYWTEYYGELPDGYWMTVNASKVSIDPGSDGSNILDSVIFE